MDAMNAELERQKNEQPIHFRPSFTTNSTPTIHQHNFNNKGRGRGYSSGGGTFRGDCGPQGRGGVEEVEVVRFQMEEMYMIVTKPGIILITAVYVSKKVVVVDASQNKPII